MVADNLKKLSKDDLKALALSGKREEMVTWLYVYEKTLAGVFGGVINRLIAPARKPGTPTFTNAEWAAMQPWQREYVRLVDEQLHTFTLKRVTRGEQSGETLMSNIIEHDKAIGNSGARLIKFICHEATNLSTTECKLVKLDMAQIKLTMSDDAETLRAKASKLRTLHGSMPATERGAADALPEALLAAMPAACSKEKENLETTINMRKALSEPLPTYEHGRWIQVPQSRPATM